MTRRPRIHEVAMLQFPGIDDFRFADAAQLRALYDAMFARIETFEPDLRVFESEIPDRDRVLRDLDALLAAWPDANARPPLFGAPAGVKGLYRTKGRRIRCGSLLPADLFTGPEASLVGALRRAGAIVVGITATTEFASREPAATANPHNRAHTPGGSSSGSAAGVAAGFFPLALGSQTLGSIIRPASFCGITGFKPSYGRVPADGAIPFSPSLDHVGFFCATPAEIATVAGAVMPDLTRTKAPRQLRLGIPAGPYLNQAAPDALARFRATLAALAAPCGGRVECVETPCLDDIATLNRRTVQLAWAELAQTHAPWFDRYAAMYRPGTREQILAGRGFGDEAVAAGHEAQQELRRRLRGLMRDHGLDAFVCPAAVGEADKGLHVTGDPVMNQPWSLAGLPALCLPAGRGQGGLPLGLQLVGDYGADAELLAAGEMLFPFLADSRPGGPDHSGPAAGLSPRNGVASRP